MEQRGPESIRVVRALNDASITLGLAFLGRLFAYIAQYALAYWLGPSDFGLFALSSTVIRLLGVMVGLGLYTACVRFGAIYVSEGKGQAFYHLIRASAIVVLGLGGAFGLSLGLLAEKWALLLREAKVAFILAIMGSALPFLALARVFAAGLNGLGFARLREMVESFLPWGLFGVGVLGLYLTRRLGLAQVGFLYNACWISTAVIGGLWLRRLSSSLPRAGVKVNWREVIRFSFPAWGIALLNQVAQRVDILLAGLLLSGAKVGIYSIASLISIAIGLLMSSFNYAFGPRFAASDSERSLADLRALYRESTRSLLTLGLPLGVLLFWGSGDLIRLLGERYEGGQFVLSMLILAQMVNIGVGGAGTLLVMTGYQCIEMALIFGSVVLNALLGVIMVPSYGVRGLAVSSGIAIISLNLGRLLAVYWRLRIHPYDRRFSRILVAALALVLTGWLGFKVVFASYAHSLHTLIIMTAVIGIVYIVLVVLLGLLKTQRRELLCMLRKGVATLNRPLIER